MNEEEAREKMIEALEKGNVKLGSQLQEYFDSGRVIDLEHPDRTIVSVEVNAFWGPWSKEDGRGNKGGMDIHWSTVSSGTGRVELLLDKDGKLAVYSQGIGKEFVKQLLCKMIDDMEWDH